MWRVPNFFVRFLVHEKVFYYKILQKSFETFEKINWVIKSYFNSEENIVRFPAVW